MLAVIGGTGFAELTGIAAPEVIRTENPYGVAVLQKGSLAGNPVLFLPRHGMPPSTPPHRINYRAHIQALVDAGASAIVAVTAVGSVDPSLEVPHLVIPDQIIDYTWGRAHTFFDDEIHHIDFTYPYDAALRERILVAAGTVCADDPTIPCRKEGVYGCCQGPRIETAAEIRRLANDGCHIVGMTAMPEASLARERNIPYAGLSIVVNKGAGVDGAIVDVDAFGPILAKGMGWATQVVRLLAENT